MNNDETWRSIPRCPDYNISNFGRVGSLRTPNAKVLRGWRDKGAVRYELRTGTGEIEKVYGHDLVASVFLGKRPKNSLVYHKDGDKLNNKLSNLIYLPKDLIGIQAALQKANEVINAVEPLINHNPYESVQDAHDLITEYQDCFCLMSLF